MSVPASAMRETRRPPRPPSPAMSEAQAAIYLSKDFFVFEVDFLALAGGTSAIVTKTITEADFQLEKLTYFADIASAAQTQSTQIIPLCTIYITETNGRPLMDNPVAVPALFGSGQVPFILSVKKIYERNSIIQLTAVNLTAATTYNLRLCLIGAKLFRR